VAPVITTAMVWATAPAATVGFEMVPLPVNGVALRQLKS